MNNPLHFQWSENLRATAILLADGRGGAAEL